MLLRFWYLLSGISFLIALLIVGKTFLFPLALSFLLAALLTPAVRFLSRKRIPEWLSTGILLFLLIGIVLFALLFFTTHLQPLFDDLPYFKSHFSKALGYIGSFFQKYGIKIIKHINFAQLEKWIEPFLSSSLNLVVSGVNFSLTFAVNLILIFFYTYFIVLYRRNIKEGLFALTPPEYDPIIHQALEEGLQVIRRYTIGLLMVIFILFLLIGSGLWFANVPHPFFWAFLGATLNIIPYIGIFSVATFSSIYTGVLALSIWKMVITFGCFWLAHILEANLITPYLIGSRIHLNPLSVLIGIVLSYEIWGIQGMIIVLPYLALLRVATNHFPELAPLQKWLSKSN